MDILTKYRPLRSLEFYQRKVVRFIHSSEGTDDLRSLGIPYGELGFDSPLHFIRCIPPELCEEFVCDKLFQKMDKTLRKGNRIFLTYDDGKIQSAIYKGQKQSNDEAILEGHRTTYSLDNVIPYKAFLRKNVGAMLVDGPHKILGPDVTYAEPKWEVGESIYYKPSKRWGVIEDRDVVRGKVFCEIRLEKSKLKKEKILRMPLWDLMTEAVPYRSPIIPKNNAFKIPEVKLAPAKTTEEIHENKSNYKDQKLEILPNLPTLKDTNDTINRNKLTKLKSKDSSSSKDISFRKSSGESDSLTIVNPEIHTTPTRGSSTPSNDSETVLIDLHNSPDIQRADSSPSPLSPVALEASALTTTVTVRRNPSRTMRPLTEYFHSQSVEVHDVYQSADALAGPDLKCKSVNNLNSQVSEEEEFTLEKYSNSLRRSARSVLAKQVAAEAARRKDQQYPQSQKKRIASLSTDNLHVLGTDRMPQIISHVSVSDTDSRHQSRSSGREQRSQKSTATSISTSANDTSGTESPPPPPLPMSLPPLKQITEPYDTTPKKKTSFNRAVSVMETVPRNYENSNFRSGSCSMNSEVSSSSGQENRKSSMRQYSTSQRIETVDPRRVGALPVRGQGGGSLSSYHEIHNETPMEFPPQYFHHAISVPAFDVPDSSTHIPPNDAHEYELSKPDHKRQISTVERQRYKKNPSSLKTKTKSVPNIVSEKVTPADPPLPHPFTIENIQSAVGKGRGIQTGYHSSYADVSLFSMFYCSNIFDKLLTTEAETDRAMKQEVKRILRNKIVKPLRLSAFCSWESVCHLREAMLPLSSKLNSTFMDSEEFLYLMFENALNIPEFIQYSNGTNDFMHQIVVKPKDRSRCQDIQFLLETSMEINNLKFKELPLPALMLCMPRCNGRLVYYEAIIPTMRLNITTLIDKGPKKCLCEMAATFECALCYKDYGEVALAYCQNCQRMSEQIHYHMGHNPVLVPKHQKNITLSLLAVICIKNNYYSAFVKTGLDKFAPWLYYEATPNEMPQVLLLDDFGRWLDKLEREPGRYRELAKTHLYLKRIITESHICIYFSPEASRRMGPYAESFMI